MPGPIPKRSDQRRNRNKPEGAVLVRGQAGPEPSWPEPAEHWHEIAKYWYESLITSGQSAYYESSDVATAIYVAEAMSRSLSGMRMSGQMFAAVMAAMTELLTTEGARRRARIELERSTGEDTDDPIARLMASYQDIAGA